MPFRRLSTAVGDAVRQIASVHQLTQQLAKMIDKAYVSWPSALGIGVAAAALVAFNHSYQLYLVRETMATKSEIAGQIGRISEVKGRVQWQSALWRTPV